MTNDNKLQNCLCALIHRTYRLFYQV